MLPFLRRHGQVASAAIAARYAEQIAVMNRTHANAHDNVAWRRRGRGRNLHGFQHFRGNAMSIIEDGTHDAYFLKRV